MKACGSLKETHRELVKRLSEERHLNRDESGWKEKGRKRWAFRAEKYAVCIIRETCGEQVLEEILGRVGGIITSDFWGAYRKVSRGDNFARRI
jgi:hypothetical protein